MSNVGDIVIVRNIVFNDGEVPYADLKSLKGRPCIIVGEVDDYFYMIPLSRHSDKFNKNYSFEVSRDDIININSFKFAETSYVKINNIFVKNNCYYPKIGYLKNEKMISLYKFIKFKMNVLQKNPLNGILYCSYDNVIENEIKKLLRR